MMRERGVLKALDKAGTQLYHFTAILIAGMGFFTDAYDLFCISGVTRLMGRLYYYDPGSGKPGTLPPTVEASLNAMALCGTLCGQLFFGWAGDNFGRKHVYGVTLIIMVACSFGQAVTFGSSASAVVTTLCLFRFWLGVGIGGDYPLSATIMAEYANTATRGAFMAAVFAQQGTGILAACAVNLLISATFNAAFPAPSFYINPILSVPPATDLAWRIVLAFGGIPALATFYFRMSMPETARFTALIARDARQAAEDMGRVLDMEFAEEDVELEQSENLYGLPSAEFARRHGKHLLGTCATWFFLDVAFYSQNLFQKDIFTAIGWTPYPPTINAMEEMWDGSRASALLALCSTVPGYWVTVATIDYLGRWIIQLQGFFFMTLFMGIIAGLYPQLRGDAACPPCIPTSEDPGYWKLPEGYAGPPVDCNALVCGDSNRIAFIVMYALTFFFANFGPNATTFIIPAEIFPARMRSTCHGISAAAGKAGAIIGAFGFLYAAQPPTHPAPGFQPGIGIQNSLIILTVTNFVGLLFTFLLPETNQKSLEELSGEEEFLDWRSKMDEPFQGIDISVDENILQSVSDK